VIVLPELCYESRRSKVRMTTGRRNVRVFEPRRAGIAAGLLMAISAGACSETAAVEGGAVCTFGERIACMGDAGCAGERTCLADLTGYGPCVCGAPDASSVLGPDASADGGT
jgi:hypothetical protein